MRSRPRGAWRGAVLAAALLLPSTVSSWQGAPDGPRPLSARGLENLAAYARLLSLIRFFHPSDAVAAVDWNRVAVAGVGAVEKAEGGYMMVWTGQRVLKHDGSPYNGVGVKPTVPVETLKGIAAGRDEVVERAMEIVGGG